MNTGAKRAGLGHLSPLLNFVGSYLGGINIIEEIQENEKNSLVGEFFPSST